MRLLTALGLVVVAAVSCGTSSGPAGTLPPTGDASAPADAGAGGTLDCAWSMGDNCWKSTVAAADACVPAATPQGTLSADATSCTYPSGVSIAFDAPLVVGTMATLSGFTMTSGGAACMRFVQMPSGISVTTSAGTVVVALDQARATYSVTCPGGATYSGPTAVLSACMDALPSKGEGEGFARPPDAAVSGHFSFRLDGTSQPDGGTLPVFDCATP